MTKKSKFKAWTINFRSVKTHFGTLEDRTMSKASLVVTFGVILGFVSCAKTETSSLRSTQEGGGSDWQVNQRMDSSLDGASSSSDECELPNSLGNSTGINNYEGFEDGGYEDFGVNESFSLAGASSEKVGDSYKPVKPAGDKVFVDIVGGPIGQTIVPDSFKASACNAGWMNSSRASAVRIMGNFQNCFHEAKTKRCLVVKREDLIAECVAQYNEDVLNSGLSQGCSSYMQNPSTRRDLESAVLREWM